MNKKNILKALKSADHEDAWPLVEKLVLPAINVKSKAMAEAPDDDGSEELDAAMKKLAVGASRLGGIPDLPPGVAWPARDDVPMEFVAQFRLTDVAPHDPAGMLPKTGHLLFFYNSQWACNDMEKDAACCAVIYYDGPDDKLQRTPPPRIEWQGEYDNEPTLRPYIHGLASVKLAAMEMVPGGVSPWTNEAPLVDFWQDWHSEHSDELEGEEGPYNHLLGYVDEQDYVDAHANGRDDQCLFQLDSDDNADMNFGDANKLFFILKKSELATRDFGKTRLYSSLG